MNKTKEITSSEKAYALFIFYNRMCFIVHTGKPCYVKSAVLKDAFRQLLQVFPEVELNV